MKIYDMKQWESDKSFKAMPGQEITEDIYSEMMNCLPPKTLPREKARQILRKYNIPVHAGFLMGEPYGQDKEGQLFLSFGMNDFGKEKRYYYLGLSHPTKKITDGQYYYMDCMNALVNDGLFPSGDFKDDADAIKTATNYEATLYKYEYRDGIQISSEIIYEP